MGSDSNDERISGAFYIGRASFRMETIEGGVVSAPALGARTPARGIGYLPVEEDLSPGEGRREEELSASAIKDGSHDRAWDEQPTTVYVETFSPRTPFVMSRSLAVVVGLLAFLSGALVSAIGFTTIKHPPDLIARAAALVRVEAERPPLAPALPSLPDTVPDSTKAAPLPAAEAVSMPEAAASESADPPALTPVGDATGEGPATVTPRVPQKRARRPARPSPTLPAAEGHWIDPFAD